MPFIEVITNAFSFISKNWKLLSVLFALGGTATVVGVIPGTQNVSNVIGQQITAAKEKLGTTASPTIVQ